MNVIITARSKPLYSNADGEFMKVIGTTAEGPKELPYMFDVLLELSVETDGTRVAHVHKDRTGRLPKTNLDRNGKPTFEFTHDAFEEYFGSGLTRTASKATQDQNLAKTGERTTPITYKGQKLKTAGVKSANLKTLEEIAADVGEDVMKAKLHEDYSVVSVLDLKDDEAQFLIGQFENN